MPDEIAGGPQPDEVTKQPENQSTGEGHARLVPEPVKPENPLAAHSRKITTEVDIKLGKISLLVVDLQEGSRVADYPGDFDSLRDQRIALPKPDQEPREFIARSEQVVARAKALGWQLLDETEVLEGNFNELQTDVDEIETRLQELNSIKGLGKVGAVLERRQLVKRKAALEGRKEELKKQLDTKKLDAMGASHLKFLVGNEHDSMLANEGIVFASEVRTKYEELEDKVLGDPDLMWKLQDRYIQTVIMPDVNRRVENGASAESRDVFYNDLKAYLAYNGDLAGVYELRDALMGSEAIFGLGHHTESYRVLIEDKGAAAVQGLIAEIAAGKIKQMLAAIEPHVLQEEGEYQYGIRSEIRHTLTPNFRLDTDPSNGYRDDFGGRVWRRVVNRGEYPNMDFWDSIKDSQGFQEIFGEEINTVDKRNYFKALKNSFAGEAIEDVKALGHYGTPEAVRNLVILAAADHKHPSSSWVRNTLVGMSHRPDWGEILDSTITTYPSLGSAREMLMHFGSSKIDIQHEVKDFILDMLRDKEEGGERADIVPREALCKGLPTSELVKMLHEQNILTEKEASDIRSVEELVASIRGEARNAGLPFSYQQDLSVLKTTVRANILKFFAQAADEIQGQPEKLIQLQQLARLSHYIGVYKENPAVMEYLISGNVLEIIRKKQVNVDVLAQVAETPLADKKFEATRNFIVENADVLLQDKEGLAFINRLIGEYGQKADGVIKGYYECLAVGVIIGSERQLFSDFSKQFRIVSPLTMEGYKEAKSGGFEGVYIAQLKSLAEKMTGAGIISEEERNKPYYKDLIRHVYPHNSGQWTTYESNESCEDRSEDVAEFTIKPRYEIDLLSQSDIRIKDGQELNPQLQQEVQAPIYTVSERMSKAGFDYEKIKAELNDDLSQRVTQIIEAGGLSGLTLEDINTPEERLFLILSDSLYGTKGIDGKEIKDLLIRYEFANFEDISDYIAGTNDRVARSSNQDYALLCEVGSFYSDRIKEVNRKLVEEAWNNPKIAAVMPEYFQRLAHEASISGKRDRINKLQVDKLGVSDRFLQQLGKTLKTKSGREYTPDQLKSIIRRYEKLTGGFTADREIDAEKVEAQRRITVGDAEYDALEEKQRRKIAAREQKVQSVYGQLRSQKERTIEAIRVITEDDVDPATVSLGEVNFQEILNAEARIVEGRYDEEQFASYTVQRFIDLFEEEKTKIEGELGKFESLEGKQREVLYATISKSKESANARMVGGVCVSGDNPRRNQEQNMWDMPNYFQLVLQEPDTLQCQGLVLMHSVTQGDKKILTASINPSSTYIYSVDEAALFGGIMGTLEEFALANGFDSIVLSQNKTIRTNRTGGEFEKAIDARVAGIGKHLKFDDPQQFSYHPNYQLQDMDIVWEKPAIEIN